MLSNYLPLLLLSSTFASTHQKIQHRAIKASTSPNPADSFIRSIPSGQVISNCKNSGDFALTFDDGVNSQSTVAIYLRSRNAHGSFFVNINNFACTCSYSSSVYVLNSEAHKCYVRYLRSWRCQRFNCPI